MLISRNWLQSYFETELPDVQKIADTLLLHSFEIEEIKKVGDDDVIDIDVLPNRAHDCLCHLGIAQELSSLLELSMKKVDFNSETGTVSDLKIVIESEQCTRYIGTLVKNVQIGESPSWLKERLASMGQKSISNLVDITNYVMFDLGQPMHVFDADKVVGEIIVRNAKKGETMTTLSGDDLELLETDLLITDEQGILALAGVKGGTKAEVDENTKNIIIEAAHFQSTSTRLTARRVKILTDASKRYENEITANKTEQASDLMIHMMKNILQGDMEFTIPVDVYPHKETQHTLEFKGTHTSALLGFDVSHADIEAILNRMRYEFTRNDDVFSVTVPFERIDLRIAEDMIEEIGRIYGYHNIPTKSVDEFEFTPRVHGDTYLVNVLRNTLVNHGFYELLTYSFVNKGDVEVLNPMASDKKALRKTIWKQLDLAVEKNAKNADYFGLNQIKVFEIGRVYTNDGEQLQCVIHIHNVNKKARKQFGGEREQLEALLEHIPASEVSFEGNNMIVRLTALESRDTYGDIFTDKSYAENSQFHSISPYQFMTRDISMWLPEAMTTQEVADVISVAELKYLKKVYLFDEFEKEGKISVAYSLVFQSDTGTLTDDELEPEMARLVTVLENTGATIR